MKIILSENTTVDLIKKNHEFERCKSMFTDETEIVSL